MMCMFINLKFHYWSMSKQPPIDARWLNKIFQVRQLAPHVDIRIELWEVGPIPTAFKKHIGEPDGQNADYRYTLKDGSGIHLKVYSDHYKMHWDKRDPSVDPLGHLSIDAPHWLAAIGIGAIVALLIYEHEKD